MITPIEMYCAECDNCGKDWEHPHHGWSCMNDEDSLKDELREEGWAIGDGQEGERDKTYCPDCWHYDNNGVFTLKLVLMKARFIPDNDYNY